MTPPAAEVLIAGAGLAGARCAEALRALGFDGSLVVAGDEPAAPYRRPALSKELLLGTAAPDGIGLRPDAFWRERDVDLRLGAPVRDVDLGARTAEVGGETLRFEHLVVATGARPRSVPSVPDAENVHRLRSLADARGLSADLAAGGRLVVVGCGFVGTEVASAARERGLDVTIVETMPVPFAHVLGAAVGEMLAERYRASGVDLRLGVRVMGAHVVDGRVRALLLSDGTRVPCGAVLVAVGTEPALDLLGGRVRLAEDGGVPTDVWGGTGHVGLHACGDASSTWREAHGRHIRLEHWTDAAAGGAAVARSIVGAEPVDPPLPTFWSDQFGWRIQMVGHAPRGAAAEVRPQEGGALVRYRDADGVLHAALALNRPDLLPALRAEVAAAPVAVRPAA